MEQICGYDGRYEIHLSGTPDGQPGVWSVRSGKYLKPVPDSKGYLTVHLCRDGKSKTIRIHRLVAEHFIEGCGVVDHIDRNKANNVVTNLRWITQAENQQNRDYKGFSWHMSSRKWRVQIKINGEVIRGGVFATEEEARLKYLELKAIYHPAFMAS